MVQNVLLIGVLDWENLEIRAWSQRPGLIYLAFLEPCASLTEREFQ
jgi:hypothetical protein